MNFFSIAIPTYEMKGLGSEFLNFSFEKLSKQSFKDFNVVISDHSENDEIKNLCEFWSSKLNIKYLKNLLDRGNSSSNLNNAIHHCEGSYIKFLFQDDFLFSDDALEKTYKLINKNKDKKWIVSACEHSHDGKKMIRSFYPRYNNLIHHGNNTISSPSVLTIKNDNNQILFDTKLIWLMDVDYYKRLYDSFGDPLILNEITVVNRLWDSQLSNLISENRKNQELIYVLTKHKDMTMDLEKIFENLCKLNFNHQMLYGRGIVDINEHLPTLRKYASECDHVTEMGTRFAISTFGFLIGKPKKLISIDLNYKFFQPYEVEINSFASSCGVDFKFIEADVLKTEIEETDMLFIDTLHTYNQLSKELRKHENKVKKWIVLHDTVTFGERDEEFYQNGRISEDISNMKIEKRGLMNALLDFLEENKSWKIKEHYLNNNGLTVLERI